MSRRKIVCDMPETEAELQSLIGLIRTQMRENSVNSYLQRNAVYQRLSRVSGIDKNMVEPGRLAKVVSLTSPVLVSQPWLDKFDKYNTTFTDCECPDHQPPGDGAPRTVMCKHMLAKRILFERN